MHLNNRLLFFFVHLISNDTFTRHSNFQMSWCSFFRESHQYEKQYIHRPHQQPFLSIESIEYNSEDWFALSLSLALYLFSYEKTSSEMMAHVLRVLNEPIKSNVCNRTFMNTIFRSILFHAGFNAAVSKWKQTFSSLFDSHR